MQKGPYTVRAFFLEWYDGHELQLDQQNNGDVYQLLEIIHKSIYEAPLQAALVLQGDALIDDNIGCIIKL